ncbi:hypothetical protein LTR50_006083 [Elasticomyces elasticus]|nr:hypothetical protein LTR50_006083 [Elasticomyces elasticus]
MPQSFPASFLRLPKTSRPVVLALCVLLFFLYLNPRRSSVQPADFSSASAASRESDHAYAAEDYGATRSKLAKVTMLFYDKPSRDSRAYESALSGHRRHDLRYGYHHFVLRQAIVEGMWSKQAYLLSILLQELAKPRIARLEWLFWHDADLVLMNSKILLDVFLPPEPEWAHIHLLCSNDLNGINAGVFFLRVHEWSAWFLAATLAYTRYYPDVVLAYSEQTVMESLIRDEKWGNHTLHLPQRWFNAYQNFGFDTTLPPEWHWTNGYFEPGDLLVHLPGTEGSRPDLIREWQERIEEEPEKYEVPLGETYYPDSISEFWASDARRENERQTTYQRRWKLLQDVGFQLDRETEKAIEEAKASTEGKEQVQIEAAVKAAEERSVEQKMARLRAAEKVEIEKGTVNISA